MSSLSGPPKFCCLMTLFSSSVSLAALCIYTAVMLARYTPVYRPLRVTQLPSQLGAIDMTAEWINVTGFARKEYENPNPYPVTAAEVSAGKVYARLGSSLKDIGVSHVQPITFPAGGSGVGETRLFIALATSDAQAMDLLQQPVLQIFMDLEVRVSASLGYLGLRIASGETRRKICGFEVQLLPSQRVGFTSCEYMEAGSSSSSSAAAASAAAAAAAAALVVLGVNDTSVGTELVRMSPEHYSRVALGKNAAFGSIVAVSAVLSVLLSARGLCLLRRRGDARSEKAAAASMSDRTTVAAEV